ncbi:MAG: hypothetical protein QG671_2766 [Actinomycetota bacterium]|nr:hypothetical protein [Actinomycetota bacterium]
MTAVAEEARQVRAVMERVETVEEVAFSLPKQDERRSKLLAAARSDLAGARPLRPRIAAELLGLSEKTVRAWAAEGVLVVASGSSSRLLLDVARVHEVLHLVRELRAAGQTRSLLDEVHRRLVDSTWLERSDLAQSLEQMRRGEGTVRVAGPSA